MFNHQRGRALGGTANCRGLAIDAGGSRASSAAQFELALTTTENGRRHACARASATRARAVRARGHRAHGGPLRRDAAAAIADTPQIAVGDVALMSTGEADWLAQLSVNTEPVAAAEPVHRRIER